MEEGNQRLTKECLAAFHIGEMRDAYRYFGAHLKGDATTFIVWAPSIAKADVLVETAEGEKLTAKMAQLPDDVTIWQAVVPRRLDGSRYQYRFETADGTVLHKSDPYARMAERRPKTRSIVYVDLDVTAESKSSVRHQYDQPLAIYELHAGTWRRHEDGTFLNYRELAGELIPYVKDVGFTHIEFLPLTEHPLDESWGYQATGYFAATSRYGEPADLKYLIDACHRAGLGVLIDWIPGHFCSDLFGLAEFNGTLLYEEEREERRLNPDWGTMNFDLRKGEVVSFLLSSAHYWLTVLGFDGFRMDALITQLFVPNSEEQERNAEGNRFLQKLTASLKAQHPGVLLIAEDANDHPNVTTSVVQGGTGFDYKWNFGWVHDVLAYMGELPEHRQAKHRQLTFSLMYQYEERYVLALSHDEVARGFGSLLGKMPGTEEERFRQLRLFLGFWITHPGKKLLFMGQEFGQEEEWLLQPELDWVSRKQGLHQRTATYTRELLAFYKQEPALFQLDDQPEGFLWLDADNHEQGIISFIRRGIEPDEVLVIICNFSAKAYPEIQTAVPEDGSYEPVFVTECARYGGELEGMPAPVETDAGNIHGQEHSITAGLPAFCMMVWKKQKRS